jgi:hypothetical protein
MEIKNTQGDAKAGKSGSDLQNETPQKTRGQNLKFPGYFIRYQSTYKHRASTQTTGCLLNLGTPAKRTLESY